MAPPVDPKTRERIFSAQLREVEFRLRKALLDGGFKEHEVNNLVEVVLDLLRHRQPITAETLAARLRSKGFPKFTADQLSRELAPA